MRWSSPARGTWIEISAAWNRKNKSTMSSPARGTWIEIIRCLALDHFRWVVPRKGDVDRNTLRWRKSSRKSRVVPRKGDVDRNENAANIEKVVGVVPRKGDVDRNFR